MVHLLYMSIVIYLVYLCRIAPHRRTTRTDDSGIVTKDGTFLKVISIAGPMLKCIKMAVQPFDTNHLGMADLDWSVCGIYRDTGQNTAEETAVSRQDVRGKVIRTGKFAVEMPSEWLHKT